MLRPHSPLFNAATDAPDAGGSGDTAPKATIGQTIKAALASKADLQARLELATTDLAARDATIATLQTDLAAAQARVTSLEAEAAEINLALSAHQKEVDTLKAAEQSLELRAAAKSKEELKSLGFPAAQLPNPDPRAGQAKELTPTEFNALDHTARNEFFRAGGKLLAA